jgi:hypothetical protein
MLWNKLDHGTLLCRYLPHGISGHLIIMCALAESTGTGECAPQRPLGLSVGASRSGPCGCALVGGLLGILQLERFESVCAGTVRAAALQGEVICGCVVLLFCIPGGLDQPSSSAVGTSDCAVLPV